MPFLPHVLLAFGILASVNAQHVETDRCIGTSVCQKRTDDGGDDVLAALQVHSQATGEFAVKPSPRSAKCLFKHKPRVRREWRQLSDEMRQRVAQAFWTLKNVSTDEGRAKYGPYFANYDEIVYHHACAVKDPRCDQGHNGPNFMTFHRLILLKTELALLAVDPGIEALPYWDMAADSVGGKYYQDVDKYIFSDKYFGSFWGEQPSYAVTDGLFANWPIAEWSRERFGAESKMAGESICARSEFFSGHEASTCSECCGKESCTCPSGATSPRWLRDHADCSPYTARQPNDPEGPQANFKLGGSYDLVFRESDFDACSQYPENVRSWMDWMNCQNVGFFFCQGKVRSEQLAQNFEFMKGLRDEVMPAVSDEAAKAQEENATDSQLLAEVVDEMMYGLHSNDTDAVMNAIETACKFPMIYGYYNKAKGGGREFPYFHHGHAHVKLGRDFLDVSSSPNDPGPFSGHHSNVDRSSMHFMLNSWRQDPSLEKKSWLYPKTQSDLTGSSGRAPYAQSGPFSLNSLTLCVPDKKTYPFYRQMAGPWRSGTLLGDVVNSGYGFTDLFNASCSESEDCSGRQAGGYTHEEVIHFSAPERTPYTYDTLEEFYC